MQANGVGSWPPSEASHLGASPSNGAEGTARHRAALRVQLGESSVCIGALEAAMDAPGKAAADRLLQQYGALTTSLLLRSFRFKAFGDANERGRYLH